jgi:hypothetical protein
MTIQEDYLPIEGAGREEFITFYSWSIDDALKAHEEWAKTNHHEAARGPFYRWVDALDLLELAEAFKKSGDNRILLQAISICALNDFVIPKWCSLPYLKAFRDVWHYRVKSWDDSFGQPLPKGSQISARSQKRAKRFGVYNRINDIKKKDPDTPIDRGLFEIVGREFCICGSLADEYYYSVKRQLSALPKSTTGAIVQYLLERHKVDDSHEL